MVKQGSQTVLDYFVKVPVKVTEKVEPTGVIEDIVMNTTNTSTDAQRICDHCNTPYEPGALYCNNCGCILPEVTSGSAHTTYLGAIERQRTDLEWGTAYFHVRAQLQLQLKSSKK